MPVPVELLTFVVPVVRLPLTRSRLIPCVPLLVDESAVKLSEIGVAGFAAFVILTAGPRVAVRLPVLLVTVIEPVFSVPVRPAPFVFVPPRDRNDILPTLLTRLTSEPGEALFTVVAPNVTEVPVARLWISIPLPVPGTLGMLVAPTTVLPPPVPPPPVALKKAELDGPLLF